MIYSYSNRVMVQFKDGSRASYSRLRYGPLLDKLVQLSVQEDKKVWNYYEIHGDECWIYYYQQKDDSIQIIKIDSDNRDIVYQSYWQLNCNGYAQTRSGATKQYLHSLVMHTDQIVDHINHERSDNRRCNLRICSTESDNMINQLPSVRNTSGIVGVDCREGRWRARIQYKGETRCEWFDTKEEAAQRRREWELEIRGF